ncbi:MAG: [FeFe] hydrogenase H-cluster radical SAM maturase HydE [Clostridia bacterium]|nr:[FeFe] hydrogenase H-cluster radical SAM maturase HydE [Clostridia bacterium]
MSTDFYQLIDRLADTRHLSLREWETLVDSFNADIASYAANKALTLRKAVYGNDVYIRGLVEISNICKNDCLYCGIRHSNRNCDRYRLSSDQILDCCKVGYSLGFRTFVLQGGEDPYYTDDVLCGIVSSIKSAYVDCAVTLSLGERSYNSYKRLFDAGADRYLLRHETANEEHYKQLHPENMSYRSRMECLKTLRKIGFQVGCGMMVGSPYQTSKDLAKDLKFIQEFSPDMCGIGPFIPHSDTPFKDFPAGSAEITCYLLSLIRILKPNILLPATTALGTVDAFGREKGLLAGANVLMPNLSPTSVRKKYSLYNNKICTGEEAAECLRCLSERIKKAGFHIVQSRGDIITATKGV